MWHAWKAGHAGEAARFLDRSNRCVRGFAGARSWKEAERFLAESRELGILLGREIGVEAEPVLPPETGGVEPIACKAVGAGNELVVAFGDADLGGRAGFHLLEIARRGVAWEA